VIVTVTASSLILIRCLCLANHVVCLIVSHLHRADTEHPDTSLYRSVLLCSVLPYSILLCAALFYSALCCPILFCSVLPYSILHCAALFYSALCCPILFCSVLPYSILHCAALFYSSLICTTIPKYYKTSGSCSVHSLYCATSAYASEPF
jgi:hypothetical protein